MKTKSLRSTLLFGQVHHGLSACLVMFGLSGCLVDAQIDTSSGGGAASGKTDGDGGGASSSTTSGTSSQTGEAGEQPEQLACETNSESLCIWNAPLGWRGPIQPQSAPDVSALGECQDGRAPFLGREENVQKISFEENLAFPSTVENRFVDRVSATDAQCAGGCESKLEIGACAPMSFVIRHLESESPRSCGKIAPDQPMPELKASCTALDPNILSSDKFAVGAVPPQPFQGEAKCDPKGTPNFKKAAPDFGDYYRICLGKEVENRSCQPGKTCTSFADREEPGRMPMSCVYKPGDVQCPAGVYEDRRIVIYGKAEDDRSCGECEVEHKKGELGCAYGINHAKNDVSATCETATPIAAEDICVTKSDLLGPEGPWTFFGAYLSSTYTGTCTAKEPAPQGEVKLGEAMTLCCAEF